MLMSWSLFDATDFRYSQCSIRITLTFKDLSLFFFPSFLPLMVVFSWYSTLGIFLKLESICNLRFYLNIWPEIILFLRIYLMKFEDSSRVFFVSNFCFPFIQFMEWGHGSDTRESRKSLGIYVEVYQPSVLVSIMGNQHAHKRKKYAQVEKLSVLSRDPICVIAYLSFSSENGVWR